MIIFILIVATVGYFVGYVTGKEDGYNLGLEAQLAKARKDQ